MNVIYLAAYEAYHPMFKVTYQDINGKRDIDGDMMDIDLTPYDLIIATPPYNYWSRANYQRETSNYAQKTKHLLPDILNKLIDIGKPFLVENVRNYNLMNKYGLFNNNCFIYEIGRHTYWTNIPFNPSLIKQERDFKATNKRIPGNRGKFMSPDGRVLNSSGQIRITKNTQGGNNVHNVINYWLELVKQIIQGE